MVGELEGHVATDDGTGKFRLLVTPNPSDPWPTGMYLRQGVRVNGWVMLDQVRLGFELWRQFNAFPPTVTPGEPQPSAKGKKAK